jgi:hypothetical protein
MAAYARYRDGAIRTAILRVQPILIADAMRWVKSSLIARASSRP